MKLIKLEKKHKDQLIEMIEEWKLDQEINKTNRSPWAIFKNDCHDYDYYLENIEEKMTVGDHVKSSVYFLYDEDRDRLCGAANIRHFLSDGLKESGGHIGDGIRPSERGKGYATLMISLALKKCPELGINDVMMTCSKDNIGSRKSIINNGGVYERDTTDEEEVEERYWINLNPTYKVTSYSNGEDFLKENREYLKQNDYMSNFFFLDAPLLLEANNKDYAYKFEIDEKKACVLKVKEYPFLVYGDKELAPYIVNYCLTNNLIVPNILSEYEMGKAIAEAYKIIHGKEYCERLAMDFMNLNKVNGEYSSEVEKATLDDVNEICELTANFFKDCNLSDKVDREKIICRIDDYRVIRKDGKIAAMAASRKDEGPHRHITSVYTRDEYRGNNFARKLVTNLSLETINSGLTASLNVDKHNPITNHLYRSIGYEPIFAQSLFEEKK